MLFLLALRKKSLILVDGLAHFIQPNNQTELK